MPYQGTPSPDLTPVWKAIKGSNLSNPDATTIALVEPDDAKALKKLVEDKKKKKKNSGISMFPVGLSLHAS